MNLISSSDPTSVDTKTQVARHYIICDVPNKSCQWTLATLALHNHADQPDIARPNKIWSLKIVKDKERNNEGGFRNTRCKHS